MIASTRGGGKFNVRNNVLERAEDVKTTRCADASRSPGYAG